MLSTLAFIANQLERDGHVALADQVDDIITALGARDSWQRYEPGEMWEDETEGQEPNLQEELEEGGLHIQEPHEVGLGHKPGFSDILLEHRQMFIDFIKNHDIIRKVLNAGKYDLLKSTKLRNLLTNDLESGLTDFAKATNRKVSADDDFLSTAHKLIREALEEVMAH